MNKQEIRKYLKDNGLNTGSDVFEGLAKLELSILSRACERTKANNRKTVYEKDL